MAHLKTSLSNSNTMQLISRSLDQNIYLSIYPYFELVLSILIWYREMKDQKVKFFIFWSNQFWIHSFALSTQIQFQLRSGFKTSFQIWKTMVRTELMNNDSKKNNEQW